MTTTSSSTRSCANCSSPVTGRFCANCGAAVEGANCAGCGAELTPGAKFCHRCGLAVGTAPATAVTAERAPRSISAWLPWAIAGVALLALIAYQAGQRFGARTDVAEAAPLGAQLPEGAAPPGMRAPDISNLSPQERATRLYNRAMQANEQGKADSAAFFATMATMAYSQIPNLDADGRYEMGRVALLAGAMPVAVAQADTILTSHPSHLLGLMIAEAASKATNDAKSAAAAHQKLVAAAPAERAKNLPEYESHKLDIDAALAGRFKP